MNTTCDNDKSLFQEVTEVCSKKHIKTDKYSLFYFKIYKKKMMNLNIISKFQHPQL